MTTTRPRAANGADRGLVPQIMETVKVIQLLAVWSRSWRHATDHGEIPKVFCDVELIVASCHRSWGNREGDTALRGVPQVQFLRLWSSL